jgi:hypothetical protein
MYVLNTILHFSRTLNFIKTTLALVSVLLIGLAGTNTSAKDKIVVFNMTEGGYPPFLIHAVRGNCQAR